MDLQYYYSHYQFFISLSYVTIISIILTLIITQIIKTILKKNKTINDRTNEIRKDLLLSQIGRIVSILTFTFIYLINEIIINQSLIFDKSLIIGLLSGWSLTLSITKGVYSFLHQYSQKRNIFEKIEYIDNLLESLSSQESSKWLLSNKKEPKQ